MTATSRGTYDETGTIPAFGAGHYITGSCSNTSCGVGDHHYHDFFVFDLSSLSGTVTAASLQLDNPGSGGADNTYTLYDVTTSTSALSGGTAGTAGYTDLGSGTSYGSVAVSNLSTDPTPVTVALNAAGVAAVQAAVGSSSLAIGGDFAPGVPGSTDDFLFASSASVNHTNVSLILTISTCPHTLSSTSGSVTIPSSGLTCGTGVNIGGNLTVPKGGSLSLVNSSVAGSLSASSAGAVTICGSSVHGEVYINKSTGRVTIGDGKDDASACDGNTFGESVTLTANTGGVELGANNIDDSAILSKNVGTGPGVENQPEVEGNSVSDLNCSGNSSVSNDGQPNTVFVSRSGQCGGRF